MLLGAAAADDRHLVCQHPTHPHSWPWQQLETSSALVGQVSHSARASAQQEEMRISRGASAPQEMWMSRGASAQQEMLASASAQQEMPTSLPLPFRRELHFRCRNCLAWPGLS